MAYISSWIMRIVNMQKPDIYSVTLTKTDHTFNWTATAYLRRGHNEAKPNYYSVDASDPEMALQELYIVLNGLICPHCHRELPEQEDE